jgi:hypothetical protein
MTTTPSARYYLAGILLATTLSRTAPPARATEIAPKRPFTPRDAIELSSFVQPTAGEESAPRPAPIVSPDGRSFLLVTERGVLASNRIESTLWLCDRQAAVDGVREKSSMRPQPRALATLSATSNQPVLAAVRWLDADRIAFLGKDGSPFQRLFLADRRTGTVTALTPDDRFVSAYDVRGDTVAYTALAPVPPKPPESDLVAVAGRSLLSLLYPEPPPLADLDGDALGARANILHVQRKGTKLPLAFTWRGKPLKLFASAWSSAPPLALSPDGSSLVTLAPVPEIPALWGSYRAGPDAENAPLRPELSAVRHRLVRILAEREGRSRSSEGRAVCPVAGARVDLPLRRLFETPTVAALAERVRAAETRPGQSEKIARVLLRLQERAGHSAGSAAGPAAGEAAPPSTSTQSPRSSEA